MTFDAILDQVAQRKNYAGGLTPIARTRLLGYLNNRHRQIVAAAGSKLRDVTGAPILTTVEGQQAYSLPSNVKNIKHLYDTNTRRFLFPVDEALIRSANPGGAVTNFGLPVRYADIGFVPHQLPIPSSNTLWVVSSSASDNTQTAYIEYVRDGGYPSSANVVLTGTTPVQLGSDADINALTKFHLSPAAAGFVTLRTANGTGTVIATLGPGQTFSRYRGVLLDPTPNANVVYTLDYTRAIPDPLLNSNDEPLIDDDWQWILVSGVLMDESAKDQSAAGFLQYKDEWEQGMKDCIGALLNVDDWIVVPNRGRLPKPYPFKIPVSDN